MAHTDKPTVVSQAVYDFLSDNMEELGLEDVWDGDQDLIPRTPALCVIQGDYARALTGAPFRTDNAFVVYVIVYHATIQDTQLTQRECNAQAEAVMDLLHTNKTMNDLVIHGYVTSMEPGYIQKKSKMYVTRITWQALTKTLT